MLIMRRVEEPVFGRNGEKGGGNEAQRGVFSPCFMLHFCRFCSFPLPVPVRNPGKSPMVLNIPSRNVKKDEKRENVRKVAER